jgi:hypothetical protein
MEALEELLKLETYYRLYRQGRRVEHLANKIRGKFTRRFGEHPWEDCCKLVQAGSESKYPLYATKPIIRWGAADTSMFRKRLSVVLPVWMEEFYNNVCGMALLMLNQIYIMPPDEAVYREVEDRECSDQTGLPYRLIRFADAAADGTGFSLRQRLKDDTWHIMMTTPRISKAEYQSDEWENEGCDNDINEWLLRMIRTDCHPLRSGGEEFEPMPYSRERDFFTS